MDGAYEMYCLTDPVFYDSFVLKGTEEHDYELAQGSVPEGWECVSSGDWLISAELRQRLFQQQYQRR